MPLRTQSTGSPGQVPTTISLSAVSVAKPQTGSPGSPANNPASPTVLQGVASPNIKQVKPGICDQLEQESDTFLGEGGVVGCKRAGVRDDQGKKSESAHKMKQSTVS